MGATPLKLQGTGWLVGCGVLALAALCVGIVALARGHAARRRVDLALVHQQLVELRRRGDDVAMAALLESVPDSAVEKSHALAELAQVYFRLNRAIDLERAAHQCLNRESRLGVATEPALMASIVLADHFGASLRYAEARVALLRAHEYALRLDRPSPEYLLGIMRHRFVKVLPPAAIERLLQFTANDPTHAHSQRALGEYLARDGQIAQARERLELALRLAPANTLCWESWLRFLLISGDPTERKQALQSLPATCDSAELRVLRGRCAETIADWTDAVAQYRAALRIEPGHLEANNRLPLALRAINAEAERSESEQRSREVVDCYNRLVKETHPILYENVAPDAATRARLAALCRRLGYEDEANCWEELP